MGDRTNRPYSDLVALLVAAVILFIMISITEAAGSHEQVLGDIDSVFSPDRASDRLADRKGGLATVAIGGSTAHRK